MPTFLGESRFAEERHASALTGETSIMLTGRKIWWAPLLLAAFTGCNSEEPKGENPPPGPATPPAVTKPGEATEAPKAEAAKPEAAKEESPKKDEAPKIEGPSLPPVKEEKKEASAEEPKELTAKEIAKIEKLPAEDKVIAIKQVVCPVTGELLGSMGVPKKVTAEGKTFMLCCSGCEGDVKDDPKAVIAKLSKK